MQVITDNFVLLLLNMGCSSNWRSIPFLIPLPAAGSGLSRSPFMFSAVS